MGRATIPIIPIQDTVGLETVGPVLDQREFTGERTAKCKLCQPKTCDEISTCCISKVTGRHFESGDVNISRGHEMSLFRYKLPRLDS